MKKSNPIKRRDFIRKTAAAGIIAAGSSFLNPDPLKASSKPRSKDIIKVGLIGCGGRGTGAAAQAMNAHENVRLVALADIFEDKIEETLGLLMKENPDKMDVPKKRQFVGFDAYRGLIEEVDVVLQATPPGFRPLHAEAAIQAGKHLFIEKPVATDVEGLKKMIELEKLAKEKGLSVTVGFNMRYTEPVRECVEKVHEGAIGDIVSMYANAYFGRVSWLKNYPRTPGMTELEFQLRNWYFFNWLSGDILVEQSVHRIDALSWAKGDYPVEAQATGGRHVRTGQDVGEVFDHFAVEYRYKDGSKAFVFARQISGVYTKRSTEVYGSNGSSELGSRISIRGRDSRRLERDKVGGHQREQNKLFESILAGETTNDLKHGIPSTQMAIMGRMAAYSGQLIKWDEILASNQDICPPSLYSGKMDWETIPKIPEGPLQDGTYPCPLPGITPPW